MPYLVSVPCPCGGGMLRLDYEPAETDPQADPWSEELCDRCHTRPTVQDRHDAEVVLADFHGKDFLFERVRPGATVRWVDDGDYYAEPAIVAEQRRRKAIAGNAA